MRLPTLAILTFLLAAGCGQDKPAPTQPVPPAKVEIVAPQGGVHVNDPAGGTKVDVDRSGVHVNTPDTKVDTR
jgi:hypothetical protein